MANSDDKTDLAKDRTDWAEDRTILANERTFAGWMRTGLAAVAVALGLRALFGDFAPDWIPKSVASGFIVTAVILFWFARSAAVRTEKRMNEHAASSQSARRMTVIATLLSVCAVATGLVLLAL